MSDVTTHTQWELLSCDGGDTDPEFDTISFQLTAHGKPFAVAVSAPKKTSASDYAGALNAALAFYIRAGGGDMSKVGAFSAEDAKMDTGDQRAN